MSEPNSDVMVNEWEVGANAAAAASLAANAGTAAGQPIVDDGVSVPPGYTFPAEDIFLSKPATVAAKTTVTDWFKAPSWKGGPPRWQMGLAGVGITAALAVVVLGFTKK